MYFFLYKCVFLGITKVPFKAGVIYIPPFVVRDGVCFISKPWSASTTCSKVVDSTLSLSVALAMIYVPDPYGGPGALGLQLAVAPDLSFTYNFI